MELSPPIISSGAPSLNFEVSHQFLELHYNTSQVVNPNLVNRRTDAGIPHQFIKTKAGLQRIAVGYRAIQTVEEQSEQLCFPALQAWHIIRPGRH